MPKFFFNVRNHIDSEDHIGVTLVSLKAAKDEAEKDIVDIMKSRSNVVGERWPEWSIEICDRKRKILLVVPFSKN